MATCPTRRAASCVALLALAHGGRAAETAEVAETAESYAAYVERSIGAPPPDSLRAALRAGGAEPPPTYLSVAALVGANAAVVDEPFVGKSARQAARALAQPSSDASIAVPLLLHLARDWSADGAAERAQCYAPIVAALAEAVRGGGEQRNLRVLVPGSGLGRLAYDLAAALPSIEVVALDPDAHALVLSAAMMTPAPNDTATESPSSDGACPASAGTRRRIYPSVHVSTGWADTSDRLRHVAVPDVADDVLKVVHDRSNVSLVAARFPQAYRDGGGGGMWRPFDAAATSFFLDVAEDVPATVSAIGDLLGPSGGTWVNCGPLAFPAAGEALGGSSAYPLSAAQLMALVAERFDVVEQRRVPCGYTDLPRRLEVTHRECLYFAARARPRGAPIVEF